jgi:hypothetical protein
VRFPWKSRLTKSKLMKSACVTLLVAVPIAYLVIASLQSTAGSERQKKVASAVTPLSGRPDLATRNIYNLPVPAKATTRRYFETNGWNTSALYVRFTTAPKGLNYFLDTIGTTRAALIKGVDTITVKQQKTFGWHFEGPWAAKQKLYGIHLDAQKKGTPAFDVLVNLTNKARPRVYAVSTIKF